MHRAAALFAVLVLSACGQSHSAGDGGAGDGSADALVDAVADAILPDAGCPPVAPAVCVTGACCDGERRDAERVPGTCDFECPAGFVEEALCDPGPACGGFDSCTASDQCALASNTCCGTCGLPTLADFDVINERQRMAHRAAVCPVPQPCPACAGFPNPNLGATCRAGTCEGFDLGAMALTECAVDSDCRLRTRGCCECGGDLGNLIAIRADSEGDYMNLVCPIEAACDDCAPTYPAERRAVCDAGRCVAEFFAP